MSAKGKFDSTEELSRNIYLLIKQGQRTESEIAKYCGVSVPTVKKYYGIYQPTKEDVIEALESKSHILKSLNQNDDFILAEIKRVKEAL